MTDKFTVVLAGGGTGGHVYPALAMGEALRERGHELLYFGDADRLEGRVAPRRNVPFYGIPALQYPRSGIASKLAFAVGLLTSVWTSRRMLKQHSASLVLGVGGYIAAPPILAAWTLRIPCVIHESNVTPGLANRLCARVADLVMVTYTQTGKKLPGNAPRETVGCPVNPKVLESDRVQACARYGLNSESPILLIVGGSLGALTINTLAVAAAKNFDRTYQILHIAGPRYHDDVKEALTPMPPGVALVGYEDKMGDAYAVASLVMCRAGSSTLAELTVLGKPSILVPSPNVTDNHQEANARGLEAEGAAEVLLETELDLNQALIRIQRLLGDSSRLASMAEAARKNGRPDTAAHVADLIEAKFVS